MDLFDEIVRAGQGTLALVRGQRNAPSFFDYSYAGLAGSFAFLVITLGLSAFLNASVSQQTPFTLSAWQWFSMLVSIISIQLASAAFVLAQMRRSDGLLPYIVTSNWTTFFLSMIALIIGFLPLGFSVTMFVLLAGTLIIWVNTLRLVVTLSPGQIAIFILVQLGVTFFAAIVVAALILPEMPVEMTTAS